FKQKAALLDQLNGTSVAALTEYAHYQAKLKRQADEHEKELDGYKCFECMGCQQLSRLTPN
ncbi:hypothetical protein, partial [Pseudomonas viridiflava]|uniref:hypothetical protein n=1 Tax=Pseudomonas viridiflava TaxID=33069 RepID=UPI0013CE823D